MHPPHMMPHTFPTWETQMLSQLVLQQYGSPAQILPTQGSHMGERAAPWVHSPWVHPGGPPQIPLVQARLQHCEGVMQGDPLISHALGPHVPWTLHGPEQQGTLGLQTVPSGRHMGLPQVPLLHTPLQQGPLLQEAPSGAQALHTPLLQMLLQQGVLGEQGIPLGAHLGAPHRPLLPQVPVQHCDEALQAEPSGRHWGFCWHTPPRQMEVQHCDASVHAVPTAPHCPPHVPALQIPVQHSAAVVQAPPSRVQAPPSLPPAPGSLPSVLRPQLATRESPPSRVARIANNQA
jgi:hypothetical protein